MQYFAILGLIGFCLLFSVFEIYVIKKAFVLRGYKNIKIKFEPSGVRIIAEDADGQLHVRDGVY